ncbi:MAG: transposase [Candidatus Uhrbacteria bacterium]|nr:transposase [Candidatus Uhrbacteria bacterium]
MRSTRMHALWVDENYPHFISSVTHGRQNIFSDVACASALIDEIRWYQHAYNVKVIAAVVMPDHFHAILWPQGRHTFSDFMRSVKSRCARRVGEIMTGRGMGPPPIGGDTTIPWGSDTYIPKIWQSSFFDYVIPSEEKLNEKILYILRNPVEDNLVAQWHEYPYILLHDDYRSVDL